MKLEFDGHYVRLKGEEFGENRHIKIYVSSSRGEDYYSFSIVKNGMEHSCLPSVIVSKSDIIVQNNLESGRNII